MGDRCDGVPVWTSFQPNSRSPNALDLKRIANMVRTIDSTGRTYVLEGAISEWPETTLLPQRIQQNIQSLHTCGFAPPGKLPCVEYWISTNLQLPTIECNCDSNSAPGDISEFGTQSACNAAIGAFLLAAIKLQNGVEEEKDPREGVPLKGKPWNRTLTAKEESNRSDVRDPREGV